jgi:hypothetical protein
MEKKYYVYYATEENAFETEKNGAYTKDEALNVAKSYLDEYEDEDDISYELKHLETYMDEGTIWEFYDKWGNYVMLVGIAPKGKLKEVTREISRRRKEFFGKF